MKYNVQSKSIEVNTGDFLFAEGQGLFVVIHDAEQGYALLNLDDFNLHTDFFESMSELSHYNDISSLKLVKLMNTLEFAIV